MCISIILHFPKGSTTITDGVMSGYDYSRDDVLISAHIAIDEAYSLFIDDYSITAKHKYISINYKHSYTIGRWWYHWNSIDNYKGSERTHLDYLQGLIKELLEHESLNGRPINSYRVSVLLNNLKDE